MANETPTVSHTSSIVVVRQGFREVTCEGTPSQVAAAVYGFLQVQFQNWQYVNVPQQYVEMVQKPDGRFEVWVAPSKKELDTKLFAVTVIGEVTGTRVREGEASPEMRERDIWGILVGIGLADIRKRPDASTKPTTTPAQSWDAFICHAHEDQESIVHPLAEALRKKGLKIWLDKFEITVGDRLLGSIEQGLRESRYGIVILSPNFFAKHWPQWELDGLAQKEVDGNKVILPVWHNITVEEIRRHSLILAGRYGVSSDFGLDHVIEELLRAISISAKDTASEL